MKIRITIDSFLDSERARVLVSKDNKTETSFIISRKNLASLLHKKQFERDDEGEVFDVDDTGKEVSKYIESVDISDEPNFERFKAFTGPKRKTSEVERTRASIMKGRSIDDVLRIRKPPRVKKPSVITKQRRDDISKLHTKLRDRRGIRHARGGRQA